MRSGKPKKQDAGRTYLPVFILLVLFELIILYFHKYSYNGLSFSDFNLFYPGNLINFIITLFLISGILLLRYANPENYHKLKKQSILLALFSLAFLISGIALANLHISYPNMYLFRQPLERVIKSLVFLMFFISGLIWLNLIWLSVLKAKSLLFLRASINTILLLFIFLAGSYLYADAGSDSLSIEPSRDNPADIAVVLGAAVWNKNEPSRILKMRLNKAADLYRRELIKKIQLTGGNAPGELSEAEAAYNYLKKYPISDDDIFIENTTTSTIEQINFIKNQLIGKKHFSSVLIISDLFHLPRIAAISSFYNIDVQYSGTDVSDEKNIFYNKVREAIGILVFWFFAL